MDYDLVKQLGAATHLAVCRKGRLRGRKVVLREIPASRVLQAMDSEIIHQKLHHPSIVSLLSVFETPMARCHVLEYCDEGSLASRIPRAQIEPAFLRDITRSISSALDYLRKELVLHRNVNPESILITCDKHAKLSDFDHAVRLPMPTSTVTSVCGKVEYASPEMKKGSPYSFPTDVWSLGCVLAACIAGTPSSKVVEAVKGVDDHFTEFLQGLLHECGKSPSSRMQIHEIVSHPFVETLPRAAYMPMGSSNVAVTDEHFSRHLRKKQTISAFTKPSAPYSRSILPSGRRTISETIVNDNLRNLLSEELTPSTRGGLIPRRIVSEPLPRRPKKLVSSPPQASKAHTARPLVEETLSDPTIQVDDYLQHQMAPKMLMAKPLPIGVTRPIPLNTDLLPPQSHKTIHGQITILHCRSLLVDYRESGRKAGHNEGEVMVITPRKSQVDIYLTPDHRSPSSLGRPHLSYTLADLPGVYWQQYNDAARLVEEIKRRTPQLVLYTNDARCTLWANGPPADIELLFRSCLPSPTTSVSIVDSVPSMRIRFSRQQRSLELMRYVQSVKGGEWIRKEFLGVKSPEDMAETDLQSLEDVEINGLHQLSVFLCQCTAVESFHHPDTPRPILCKLRNTDSVPGLPDRPTSPLRRSLSAPSSSVVRSLTTTLAPRPNKLSYNLDLSDALATEHLYTDSSHTVQTDVLNTALLSADIAPMAGLSDSCEASTQVQTRFISSTGWCIRYGSRVSQGGRFKIMFIDGATLDINVDEDWAQFTDPSGECSRHGIRDSNTRRQISDRFRQFEAFLTLFEK